MSTTTNGLARPRGGLRPPSDGDGSRGERPRVYTGRSVEELIPQIERELGRDAIVTRQRSGLGGGVAGFFQRPFVEIEARPGPPRVDVYDEPNARPVHPELRSPGAVAPPAHALDRFATALADAQDAVALDPLPIAAPPGAPAAIEPVAARAPTPAATPAALTDDAADVHARLLARGIERELADELVAVAGAHAHAQSASGTSFADAVASVLRRRVPTPAPWAASGGCVALIGPGGSGKTSFCAALASSYRERSALRVACATILADGGDAHSLLLSPHVLAPTDVDDARATLALTQARADGLLLIDTPSVATADAADVARLQRLLERIAPDRVVLALPATYGARAAAQLLDAVAPLRPTSIAITHACETDQLGAAVQAACEHGVAPAFLLDQRRGGDGLLQTDSADLAGRLLG